jgi:hypothetical protein
MATERSACPRCLEFEEEIRVLQQQLAASGQYVMYSPGPNSNPNVEEELQRWLRSSPNADAASGFRAGWTRLSRFLGPRLRDWESRWLRAKRDREGLRMHIGVLVAEVERLRESR